MREILFRGKRCDNGEWVEGYYARKGVDNDTFKHFICVMTFNVNRNTYSSMFYLTDIEVIPETVGQYTGMNDKNGKKIFEHDIVRIYVDFTTMQYVISYDKENARFVVGDTGFTFWSYISTKIEVIGNVHDNLELLNK